jgi:hypothetical protein
MAGSTLSDPAISHCLVNRVSKPTQWSIRASRPRDLAPAAVAPRRAAAATAAAAAATSATAATSAAAATAPGYLHAAADVFLVEQMERRQADVGDFLVTEDHGLSRYIVRRLLHVRRRHGSCGCASHQRQSQSRGPKGRCSSFGHTLRLRSLLHSWHSRILQIVKNVFRVQRKQLYAAQSRHARLVTPSLNASQYKSFRFMFMNNRQRLFNHTMEIGNDNLKVCSSMLRCNCWRARAEKST